MSSGHGGPEGAAAGTPRPDNPFVSPSARPAPPPRPYASDYPGAPLPGTAPSPYAAAPAQPQLPSWDDGAPVAFPGSEHVDRDAVLGGQGYTSGVVRNDPLAVAALVLGVLAVVPGVGLAAVVCGHLALRRLRDGYAAGRGLAVAGLALGYTLTALWVLLLLAIWGTREAL